MKNKRLAPKYEIIEPWISVTNAKGVGTYRFRIIDGLFKNVEYQYETIEPDEKSNQLQFTYKILCMPVLAIGPAIIHDNIEDFERTIGNILDHCLTLIFSNRKTAK